MKEILDYTLIEVANTELKVFSILKLILFVLFVIIVILLIKKMIFRLKRIDISKRITVYHLSKYVILVFSFVIGLQIMGLNLSVLLAGSAALLVGIGLGLQNLFSDFVSGIVLLIDSTVKVNDIIELNGLVCQVQEINLRTTTVLTREDNYIIIPNSQLTKYQLINWTYSGETSRFEVQIGVDYSSDLNLVMKILKDVTIQHKDVQPSPVPFVRFTDYADSALIFKVFFWSDNVFRAENIKAEIRIRVYEEFRKHAVNIPFPQRVVHITQETNNPK